LTAAAAKPVDGLRRTAVGLYVHVPFCATRCAYCTFVTTTDRSLQPRLVGALAREIRRLRGRESLRPLATLYLGGGTPSLLDAAQLEVVLTAVSESFDLAAGAEVTLEANPDDVTAAGLASWHRLGVTRVSIGVQSLDDTVLAMLSRRHSAAQAREAVKLALAEGLDVSVDLMLGLPRQTDAALRETVAEVLRLRPQHVSVYLLETDKPHALARLAQKQPGLLPDADHAASQYLATGGALVRAGYRHYELSNWALPGFAARHNVRYWRRAPVLAVGPAAHGQAGRRRWANRDDLEGYVADIEGHRPPHRWSRRLTEDEIVKERVMLGLRLACGIREELAASCASKVPGFGRRLDEFVDLGLARRARGRVRLTPKGWLLSNELLAELW
jgi:oxygen-independent coproporphyrinogen-3 oxidase